MTDQNQVQLSIVEANKDIVVVGVEFPSRLAQVSTPGFNGDEEFVSVTRGENHVMTVHKKDQSHYSFNFGIGGFKLVSDKIIILKKTILAFIKSNGIDIEARTTDKL